ncbi:hypothetical protein [Mycolicibacterium hippocampi]|uniref:Uncharacterized protein n=1 Tax=Mycolicibacterium hippocampi TaxID=659824 RepID=A0A7I9ZL55_9MYCO|nr:hypothetical protein [Mycolicibacterium hippocampi]GFH01704.1 hypothetical protein MHIP_21870 [Mycolicibacterium hippocampi]
MAEAFDVPSRLADGRPAVDILQQYVWACRQLGYQHPDMTLHPGQLRDWYGSEDGMDLAVLHSDQLALQAAAEASQDALAVQDRQLTALAEAWQGAGAEASRGFLQRHREAAVAAATAVRTAAEAVGALRECLWQAVDTKVEAVVTIENATQAQRADWLAAASTVTTGAGDRATAAEMIDQAVKPFVDNEVRNQALTALRTAMSSVADAYQRATAEMVAERTPAFEVPGDLGPRWSAPPATVCDDRPRCEDSVAPAPAPAAWTAPAAATVPAPAAAVPSGVAEQSTPPVAPVPAAPSMPPTPPLAGMGTGMPDLGGGLSGLGQQFADTLGGLLGGGGLDGAVPDPPELDVPDLEDTVDDEGPEEEAEEEADEEVEEADIVGDEPVEETVIAAEPEADECAEPEEVFAEPPPAPTAAPPPAEPLPPVDMPPADPVAAEQTPCAIAADELPQVGDLPAAAVNEPGAG